ncbi:hypothetical protein ACJIZ3_014020 [Penstemon smallii]|uniref:NB-ARC domain-containing protein n=1 Tax=Penstemon smallii TaxID=265156 RepID=A0ABD3RKA1_9LAMI
MAVYASLVSLIHVIDRHQNPPPPYAFLTILQTQPLSDQVSFLLDFVENYSQIRSKDIQLLERRIVAAAYKAEDVIEGYRVFEIRERSGERVDEAYAKACEDLEKVVQEMDLITKDVLKIKPDSNEKNLKHDSIEAVGSSSSSSSSINNVIAKAGGKNTMVGFDDDLINLKEKLTTHQSDRLVLPIVGMGGIGKTTLATNTYNDPFVKSYFVIRAWVTVSQDYSFRKVILGLLYDTGLFKSSHENLEAFTSSMHDKSDGELGEKLHKALFERKYLIVLDDIWSITAWDEISKFLPDNGNGSRIMITTRLSILALSLGSLNHYHEMKFLDDDVSWNLLSEMVFDQGEQVVCPPELEKFGQIIAKNCRGLPLAIVVIGGLLKVSDKTREYWSEVAENVSFFVNEENDEQCLRILSLSYNELPIQLKSLFLYMAIFPEDSEVTVSMLIKLWVAEGFLKPPPPDIINKTLEKVAEKYFKDLINRNLIMVQKRDIRGNIKTCKIHDLLRDFCLREAHKERFLCIGNMYKDVTENIIGMRRLGIHSNTSFWDNEFSAMLEDLQSMSFARTVVLESSVIEPDFIFCYNLLRVLHANDSYVYHDFMPLHNSRYLAFSVVIFSD